MEREELKLELKNLADRFSEGWHEGIKIDASDIMLLNEAAQALAQRTWVGLTKEDKDLIEDLCEMMIGDAAFSTIDAILKGKNT
jgi:hypothetical protein